MAKKPQKTEEKQKLSFSAVYHLNSLIGKLSVQSVDDFEKAYGVREVLKEAMGEHQDKMQIIYDEEGLKEGDKITESAMTKLNALFIKPASMDIDRVKVYSKDEIHASIGRAREKFVFDDLELLFNILIK